MAYQALARKWRPHNFGEVIGQDPVVRALTHALQHDRLHHAYLFTGTRGVGKTSIARILAKALNCEARQGHEPCGVCANCRDMDEGHFTDMLEVDAASRTKVEDTRELLENVQYAPTRGRYKVYLIDEVHMLTGHSFNALLKTLEEPPEHIKFLLATTDPQKIPVTVLSRCLQFNLKRHSPELIRTQMEGILREEGIPYEINAIRALARAADGSMRDGLSLLDQAIVHGDGRLQEAEVSNMLGTVARQPVFELLHALTAHDAEGLLRRIAELDEFAPSYADVLQQMLTVLHHMALAQWAPDAIRHDEDAEAILGLAGMLSPEDVQLFYQIALIGQRDLPLAPEPRCGFEMILLRMLAFRPASLEERPGPVALAPKPLPAPSKSAAPPASAYPAATVDKPADRVSAPVAPVRQVAESSAAQDWPSLIRAMGLVGLTQQLANNCLLEEINEQRVNLILDARFAQIRTPQLEAKLESLLQTHFGKPLKLSIRIETPTEETPALQSQRLQAERQKAAEAEIEADENVRAFMERFDARIVPGSIKPLDQPKE